MCSVENITPSHSRTLYIYPEMFATPRGSNRVRQKQRFLFKPYWN